jgi:hypothetical protein
MKEKECTKCGEFKEIKFFEFRKDTNKYRSQCRQCHKGYSRLKADKQREVKEDLAKGLKTCGKCKKVKSVKNYHLDANNATKLTSWCKQCKKKYQKENIEQIKKTTALRRYGVSGKEYENLMSSDSCSICKKFFSRLVKPVIDHCHSTGRVRGLICYKCNLGLGLFFDDPKILKEAIKYLSEN